MDFPESKRTNQNLAEKAKRFDKERCENIVEINEVKTVQNQVGKNIRKFKWTTEMKIDIAKLDNEEISN